MTQRGTVTLSLTCSQRAAPVTPPPARWAVVWRHVARQKHALLHLRLHALRFGVLIF